MRIDNISVAQACEVDTQTFAKVPMLPETLLSERGRKLKACKRISAKSSLGAGWLRLF